MNDSNVILSRDFVNRVSRENMWTRDYTLRVIEEYKKFLCLGTVEEVAPSREIDQVWHTHILYTKDYKDVCENILNVKMFHHNPKSEADKGDISKDVYQSTKESYYRVFKQLPDPSIWTDWKDADYVYINTKEYTIIKNASISVLFKLLLKKLKLKFYELVLVQKKKEKNTYSLQK